MTLDEPRPAARDLPRYSDLPFPPYRFVPGLNPHPVVDPGGHSFGRRPETPAPWSPDEWRTLSEYLYGIDLFNHAYWWECHEILEGLWHAAGRRGEAARFVKALIHLAAGNLNRHRGKLAGARRQAQKALALLEERRGRGPVYMGIDVDELARLVRISFAGGRDAAPPVIRLLT